MNPFQYTAPASVDGALAAMRQHLPPDLDAQAARPNDEARFIAGGTNLLDLMKEGVMRPPALVSLGRLPQAGISRQPDGRLRLGAGVSNAETADHPLVRQHAPLLRAAILAGASPQIRNMASNGGNLLQRTRCYYFYDIGVPCNKHMPGSGCPAVNGLARLHAILGASEHCIATHPSDMCVALAALDAVVLTQSPRGPRRIPFGDFHRLPGDRPDIDTTLAPDELVTEIELPPSDHLAGHSTYFKVRERASYAFAIVSVAAALDLADDGTVRSARLALGGVAHKPWRDRQAEALLQGQAPTLACFEAAAHAVLADARAWGGAAVPDSLPGNAYKVPLARRAIVRALEMATRGILTNTGEDAFRAMGDTI